MASPDRPSPVPTVRVRQPADLVAALPYLLGFHPRESLVLVSTGGDSGHRIGLTVRIDLPPPEHSREVADAAVESLLLDAPAGAAVIVVAAGGDPPARALVDRVVDGLEHRHVHVHTVIWAESTAGGGRWACYDPCGCHGVLPDPAGTVVAAAAVAGGQVALAERESLERHVAPADAERIGRREAMLVEAHDRAVENAPDPVDRAGLLAVVDAALDDAVAGRLVLDDRRVVALALALVDPLVRDTAMLRGGGGGPLAAAAEHLWAALAREMPDPEAAEPAALLAASAILRGDGALANVAVDRAEQAWPGHRLAGLLRQVTRAGMRPAAFRACLGHGFLDVEDVAVSQAGPRS